MRYIDVFGPSGRLDDDLRGRVDAALDAIGIDVRECDEWDVLPQMRDIEREKVVAWNIYAPCRLLAGVTCYYYEVRATRGLVNVNDLEREVDRWLLDMLEQARTRRKVRWEDVRGPLSPIAEFLATCLTLDSTRPLRHQARAVQAKAERLCDLADNMIALEELTVEGSEPPKPRVVGPTWLIVPARRRTRR